MKKYIYFLIAVSACLFVGCSDDDDNTVTIDSGVVGEWQLIEWNGNKAEDFDVYLELLSDGSFNLYQRVEYSYYEHFAGTFSVGSGVQRFSSRFRTSSAARCRGRKVSHRTPATTPKRIGSKMRSGVTEA